MIIIRILGNSPNTYNRINMNRVGTPKSNKKKTSVLNRVGERYRVGNSKRARKCTKKSSPRCKLGQTSGGTVAQLAGESKWKSVAGAGEPHMHPGGSDSSTESSRPRYLEISQDGCPALAIPQLRT